MKLTYAEVVSNPELLERLVAEARRERALAIKRLVFAPIAAFFRPAKHKAAAANIACGSHAARPHLASCRARKASAAKSATVVYRTLVDTIDVPRNDNFQVITEHSPRDAGVRPRLPRHPRSDGFVSIQITSATAAAWRRSGCLPHPRRAPAARVSVGPRTCS